MCYIDTKQFLNKTASKAKEHIAMVTLDSSECNGDIRFAGKLENTLKIPIISIRKACEMARRFHEHSCIYPLKNSFKNIGH